MFSSVIIACENNSLSVVCLLTFAVYVLQIWFMQIFVRHKKTHEPRTGCIYIFFETQKTKETLLCSFLFDRICYQKWLLFLTSIQTRHLSQLRQPRGYAIAEGYQKNFRTFAEFLGSFGPTENTRIEDLNSPRILATPNY